MKDRHAGGSAGLGQHARTLDIAAAGKVRLGFGLVHGGVGRGIDHEARLLRRDDRGDGGGIGNVDVGAGHGEDRHVARPCQRDQFAPDLAGGAEDEQRPIGRHLPDRHEASRAAPSRSPRYTPERILPHQAGLSRYQRTVLRSPLSKVSRGSQPSSRLILPASMA